MQFEEPGKVKPGGKIFLRDTRSTPGMRGQYLCLSYCWGSHLPLRTLKANLAEMARGIPWDKLPKTFQDAVHLTKVLGLSYLWIDALCIVQDDPTDWSWEASRMSTIYSDSYLTVAATFGENSDSGLYSLLEANDSQQHLLPGANGTIFVRLARHATSIDMSDDTYVSAVTKIPADPTSIDHASSSICRTPLMTRAWPLQEYLLPSRILQFGPREMIWECNADIFCECRTSFTTVADPMMTVGPGIRKFEWEAVKRSSSRATDHYSPQSPLNTNATIPRIMEPMIPDTEVLKYTWFRIVSAYTAKKLTYQEDKLIALSGIASIIKETTGWAYYAGVWEHHIVESLQWRSFSFHCRSAVYTAPTWSWASSTELVELFGWNDETGVVEVLDIACTPAGADICGRMTDGYIVVHGPVLEVTEVPDRDAENGPFLSWRDQLIEYGSDYLCDPSTISQAPSETLICLILSTGYDVIHNNDRVLSSLVLRRCSGTNSSAANEKRFERVGYYAGTFFNHAYLEHMERLTLHIV